MKKVIFLFFFMMILFVLYGISVDNPHWENGIVHPSFKTLPPILLSQPQFDTSFSVTIDYAHGIYFGALYNSSFALRLSKLCNISAITTLGRNIPYVKTFGINWEAYPIPYLQIRLGYNLHDLHTYRITEHNLSVTVKGLFDFDPMPRWFEVSFLLGLNMKFIDIDSGDPAVKYRSEKYRSDWFFENFILGELAMLFSPAPYYSVGFSIGNYDPYITYTANYWQVVFTNEIHIPYNISVFIKGGFSFSGSFSFAANLNRGWAEIGVRYAFK